jgi:hypothetical protein
MPVSYGESNRKFVQQMDEFLALKDTIFQETEAFLDNSEKWALEMAKKELEGGEVAHH